eukprot:CAMPEP_0177329028 /NCGR_PEP_ID=MMETSP0368-20130122/19752_1 /TAXON_ID=447022 ORGANISM="Scrippsiella hangoei-like, Strain SHHI-4" /NCGR_SAMPLE_ID=MMETSP0368 /ASSEMBLY_ACC=CAM_ASM_000363 /LENGTH=492 /DNA_ID=CAMNT_0018789223 /DNA_START=85 /DNA_END=1560 /DNA_ORIENTATION=+
MTAFFCASVFLSSNGAFAATVRGGLVLTSTRRSGAVVPELDVDEASADAAAAAVASATQQLGAVPPPADIGPDGFPKLPTVSNLLNDAQSTAQSLSAQASSLEKRVGQVQKEKAARMAKQKEIFEKKLMDQEQTNRVMLDGNKEVSKEIETLKSQNAAITKHGHEIQDSNALMRSELAALQSRLRSATDFVTASLVITDDSKAKELAVLDPKVQDRMLHKRPPQPRRPKFDVAEVQQKASVAADAAPPAAPAKAAKATGLVKRAEANNEEDEAEEDDDSEDDSEGASLLAIASEVHQEPSVDVQDPRSILLTLERGVADLQKQEQASEGQLKQMFFKDFQVGAKRHAALVAQQQGLNSTRDSLTMLQQKLKVAESRLQSTQDNLTQRLRELGLFVQKLGHLSMAPAPEVAHLLQSLPATVAGEQPKSAQPKIEAPAEEAQLQPAVGYEAMDASAVSPAERRGAPVRAGVSGGAQGRSGDETFTLDAEYRHPR